MRAFIVRLPKQMRHQVRLAACAEALQAYRIEEQAAEVRRVKKFESGMVIDPRV